MSLTTGRDGAVVVLDQVNQRMVRLDRNGKVLGTTSLPVQAAQDVVLAKDGTAVVLDRLADRSLAIIGPDGAIKGELALVGKGLPEGGAATGVFLDGDDVYVEREHGDLVRAGTTAGVNDPLRPEVPGRPTRDGRTFLSATLVDRAGGTLTVTAIDRPSLAHRFTRQYGLGHPAVALVLLDADAAGTFYVGALQELATTPSPGFSIAVLCLDGRDGHVVGHAELPANTDPDETFRELTVPDEGGVLYLYRTPEGAELRRAECAP